MHSVVSAIALCLLLCAAAPAQQLKRADPPLPPVHTIRTETMTITEIDGQGSEGPRVPLHTVTYDRAGQIMEIANYNADGSTARRTIYTYDAAGKQRSGLVTRNGDGTLLRKVEYAFDDAGRRTGQTNFEYDEGGALFRKTVISVDERDGLSEVKEFDPSGALVKTYNFPLKPDDTQLPPRADDVDDADEEGEASTAPQPRPQASRRGAPRTEDQIVRTEYWNPKVVERDEQGSWTKMITSASTIYASGRTIKKTTVLLRTITYY